MAHAIGLVHKIAQRAAGGYCRRNIAFDDKPALILLHLLEENAGYARAQFKKLRPEPFDGHDDEVGIGPIGLSDQIDRILLRAQQWTIGGHFKQGQVPMPDRLHVELSGTSRARTGSSAALPAWAQ
jgi:hypothetical protein